MTIDIPEDIFRMIGRTEDQLQLDIACALFDSGRLDLFAASRLARLDRVDFEGELRRRGIAPYRPTAEDIKDEAATLDEFRRASRGG